MRVARRLLLPPRCSRAAPIPSTRHRDSSSPAPRAPDATACRLAMASGFTRSVSLSVEAPAVAASAPQRRHRIFLRHGESAAGGRFTSDHDRLLSKSGRADSISVSVKHQQLSQISELILRSYQVKNIRVRPVFALENGGSPNSDGQDFEEDSGFLGRTRLGRFIQAAARELLEKFNSGRTNSPTKIFLVLLGFYTANALATILGQTGDWDVLVAAVVVAAIEGIGMLMYRKPVARPPGTGRFQSLIAMINYWKGGVCLGLFVDAFKVGS